MIKKRYHIRSGAKTTAGGTVRASITWYKLDGVPLACEGDRVDCPACGTEGLIQCVRPRLPDHLNGKQFALSEDLCICNCNPPPKLIADQTVKFHMLLLASEAPAQQTGSAAAHLAMQLIYDEQPRLVAPPIEGLPYFVETRDGRTFSGRAGPGGLLPRIETTSEDEYTILWGDEALAKTAEPQHVG